MKRKIKYLMILLGVTVLFGGYQYYKHAGLRAYTYVRQSEAKIDSLADGQYQGAYSPFNILSLARVEFKVENGKIQDFNIPRLIATPWNSVKPLIQDTVRTKQSLRFDAVSGATRSSFFVKAAMHSACGQKNPRTKKQPKH